MPITLHRYDKLISHSFNILPSWCFLFHLVRFKSDLFGTFKSNKCDIKRFTTKADNIKHNKWAEYNKSENHNTET